MTTFTAYHVTSADGMSEHMTLEAATMHFLKVSAPAVLTKEIYKNNIYNHYYAGYSLVSSEELRKK